MLGRSSLSIALLLSSAASQLVGGEPPGATDPRVTIELFAEQPAIVTPTGIAVDHEGRVFVAESHTHFRPDGYDGPAADRILVFSDSDGDGRAENPTVFHEGFVHVMDIEFHRDGSLYVATRKDIHRMRDTDRDGRADEITPVVRLETKGNYPHNGLSGIAFDMGSGFHFGLGENLGESYTLIGSDGVKISGGGEGGSTYFVDSDGRNLRRVSTGWWNPYGVCTDSFGRAFGTDNDPDSSPPCRLIQIIQDANYGYEFRYGRSGRNPLVCWDGEIPGTFPMIAGTGEAPCHIVAYESDALPAEYFGNLLVPSWADNRIERYQIQQRADRSLVEAKREIFIEGSEGFRPVGIDVAPDGTIYVSDWVSSSYTLHKLGRIWRIRPKELTQRTQSKSPGERLAARDRRIREAAAIELSGSQEGREVLRKFVESATLPQAQATALTALSRSEASDVAVAVDDGSPLEVRIVAARCGAGDRGSDRDSWRNTQLPVPLRAALLGKAQAVELSDLAEPLEHPDLWLRHAAVGALYRQLPEQFPTDPRAERQLLVDLAKLPELAQLLAFRRLSNPPAAVVGSNSLFLRSKNPAVRFSSVKWIADDKLERFRPALEQILTNPDIDLRIFLAIHVALDRLDGKPLTDRPPADRLIARVFDEKSPSVIRQWCLRILNPVAAKVPPKRLARLFSDDDPRIRVEAVRALGRLTSEVRFEFLLAAASNVTQPPEIRAIAIAELASKSDAYTDELVAWSVHPNSSIRQEALRCLVGAKLTAEQTETLRKLAVDVPSERAAVLRILEPNSPANATTRPAADDIQGWLALIGDHGNAEAGERVFLGAKIGRCGSCHQVDGLGAAVGPDLSTISRRVALNGADGRRWLMETILHPSRDMAPQFTPWQIVTTDGRQLLGLPLRKGGNSEAYLGTDGREFILKNTEIESRKEAEVSIMPEALLQQLTDQELTDLFAFLLSPRGL